MLDRTASLIEVTPFYVRVRKEGTHLPTFAFFGGLHLVNEVALDRTALVPLLPASSQHM